MAHAERPEQEHQLYPERLARVSELIDIDPSPDSAEGKELAELGSLVEAYEAKHFPDFRAVPEISEETRRTFEAISDPKNAHLFTVEAALKAFAHVKR